MTAPPERSLLQLKHLRRSTRQWSRWRRLGSTSDSRSSGQDNLGQSSLSWVLRERLLTASEIADDRGGPRRSALKLSLLRVQWCGWLLAVGFGIAFSLICCSVAQADVGPAGDFQHDVSVQVPAFHGLEPHLALAYSSTAGNGWVGQGWRLAGMSAIRRESSTGRGAARWDGSDTYSLDGVQLIDCRLERPHPVHDPLLMSPSCARPAPGLAAYTGSIENGQRVGFDSSGKGRWTVWRKDGVIETYEAGMTAASGTVEWWLTTSRDLSGNIVHYDWTSQLNQNVAVLRSIRYSDIEVRFQTEIRPDQIAMGASGAILVNRTRLQVVDVLAGGKQVRAYDLRYKVDADGSRQSRLTSVQEFGADATVDLTGVHGGTSMPATHFSSAADRKPSAKQPWTVDTQQATKTWTASWPTGPGDDARWSQVLDGGGTQGAVPWTADDSAGRSGKGPWMSVDVDGDGLADAVLVRSFPDAASVGYTEVQVELTQDGGGFQGFSYTVPWICSPVLVTCPLSSIKPFVADVNGDGLSDILLTGQIGTDHLVLVQTLFNQGHGEFATKSSLWHSTPVSGAALVGDVDGDGKADVVAIQGTGHCVRVALGNGAGEFDSSHTTEQCWSGPDDGVPKQFQLVDVNGDHKADLASFEAASDPVPAPGPDPGVASAKAYIAVSRGGGSFDTKTFDTGQHWAPTSEETQTPGGPSDPIRCEPTRSHPICYVTSRGVPHLWMDSDGDGRTDLVVLRPGDHGKFTAWTALSRGDGTLAAMTQGTTPIESGAFDTVTADPLEGTGWTYSNPDDLLSGDVNGDGSADLVVTGHRGTSLGTQGAGVSRSISDRRGDWAPADPHDRSWTKCSGNCWLPSTTTMVGDVNGDGRDDVMFAHYSDRPGATDPWTALDVDPSAAGPATASLLRGDYNADGRTDLMYPIRTATGVQVRVLLRHADGTYLQLPPVDYPLPDYVPVHLAQSAFTAADINGDRRSDIIILPPERRVGIDLIAVGAAGFKPQIRTFEALDQQLGGVAMMPTGPYLHGDVDADSTTDLIHVGVGPTGVPGVLTVFGRPKGELSEEWRPINAVSNTDLRDAASWHALDVDGDGATDLVHVDTTTGLVQTLLRRGSSWHTLPPQDLKGALFSSAGGDPTWMPADVNGDGLTDLVQVAVNLKEFNLLDGAAVQTLISTGDGTFVATHHSLPQLAGGPTGAADTQHWYPVDANHDARTDLVRVFNRAGEITIQTATSDGDGSWHLLTQQVTTPSLLDTPPTDRWNPGDFNGQGQLQLSRLDLDNDQSLVATVLSSTLPRESIDQIKNGAGATTTISYHPITDTLATGMSDDQPPLLQCRLPEGLASIKTVAIVTTSDAATQVHDESTVRLNCPHYSVSHGLVGWADTWTGHHAASNHPASIRHVQQQVFDNGLTQTTLDATTDLSAHVLSAIRSTYAPVTASTETPQPDLLTHVESDVCDDTSCATTTSDATYDSYGNPTTQTVQAAGASTRRQTLTTYDTDHDPRTWLIDLPSTVRVIDPDHPHKLLKATSTCYDGDTPPNCSILQPGRIARGLPTLTRGWDSTRGAFRTLSTARYDQWGNKTTWTDAATNTSSTEYDPTLHLHPIKTCNALHQCSQQPEPWDRRADAPTQTINTNGAVSHAHYDGLGRITHMTTPTGATTTVDYRTSPLQGTIQTSTVSGAHSMLVHRTFTDGLGRTYRTESPTGRQGTATSVVQTRWNDASNRPAAVSLPTATSTQTRWETFGYDAAGRLTSSRHPDASLVTRRFFVHDGMTGTTTTDEKGHDKTELTNGWGDLTAVEQPSTEHPGHFAVTRYGYDALGERTTSTDPHHNTTIWVFDSLGHLNTEDDPDRGRTTNTYDLNGNLKTRLTSRGDLLTFDYDPLNRRTRKLDGRTHAVVSWNYDEAGHGFAAGRLTSEQDPSAAQCPKSISRSINYDVEGNPTQETRCVRGRTVKFWTRYDQLDRVLQMTYPDRQTISYHYNGSGQLFSVAGYVKSMDYDAAGRLTAARYANRTSTTWTYNSTRGWLTSQTVQSSNHALLNLSYRHEKNGQVRQTTSTTNNVNEIYRYDALNRLTRVAGTDHQQVAYDDLDNITTNSTVGTYTYRSQRTCSATSNHATCAGPHAQTSTSDGGTYTYDPTGNTTSKSGTNAPRSYTWNSDGLLRTVSNPKDGTTTSNTYDANGERVEQTGAGGHLQMFGPLADWTPGTGLRTYIYAAGRLIAQHSNAGTLWFHTDRDGSPRLITNAHAKPMHRFNYTPWGAAKQATTGRDPGFNGKRRVGATGLIDLKARDYDPRLGRLISADSIIPDPNNPQALNRYSYAYNNPIAFGDPSGHAPEATDQQWRYTYFALNAAFGTINGFDVNVTLERAANEASKDHASPVPPPADPAARGSQTIATSVLNKGTDVSPVTPVSQGSSGLPASTPPDVVDQLNNNVIAVHQAGKAKPLQYWPEPPLPSDQMLANAKQFALGVTLALLPEGVGWALGPAAAELGVVAAVEPGVVTAAEPGMLAAANAQTGAVGDTIQLFRNVDPGEFSSIASSGKFSTTPGQMEGKWFATQGEHADQWGQVLNQGRGLTVETRIPSALGDQLHFHPGKLDGIGPGLYANEGQLGKINMLMDGIRVWP